MERDDVQPVEEVLPESPGSDLLQKIPVRRGDEADVDLDHLLAADAGDLPLLEDAKKLHLHPERHLAHLVEKEAPPVGLAELPLLPPVGAGEGPLLVAEELRFEKGLGDRRAVEPDERAILPEAVEMDEPRDHLLARPRFAGDEDRRLRGGDLGGGVEEPGHGGGAADQVPPVEPLAEAFLQEAVLLLQMAVVHRPFQCEAELVEIEWFGQVVVGPLLERLDGRLHGGVGGHDDDGDRRVEGLDLGQAPRGPKP